MTERFRGVPGHPFEFGFDLRLVPEKLGDPLRWRTPRMVFVNSMSDLFHEDVPDSYVLAVARVMVLANWHTYQVLTKRAERLAALLHGELGFAARCPNIWWGVSVEDRRYGLPRISHLSDAPASVRFLSIVFKNWNSITYIDCFSGPWNAHTNDLSDTSFAIALEELRKARDHDRASGRKVEIACRSAQSNRLQSSWTTSGADVPNDDPGLI